MEILYLIKQKPDETLMKMIIEQEQNNQIKLIYLDLEKDYERILDNIEACDKVISW